MDCTWTAILALICIFVFMTRNTTSRRCHLPPGPTPLPLIGSLLHIQRGALVPSLFKLWDQYGSVYTLYLGSKPAVVLCGYETVKEALVDRRDEFGGRGPIPVLERFTQGYGFILSNGKQWNILRNFTMKNFGFGKKSSEWKIRKEAQCVVEEFRKLNAKLHKEIDHVIGRDREPNYDDRLHMPYTQAVINEIQRFCDVAPLNVPHMVTRDVQFRGYEIPKVRNKWKRSLAFVILDKS
ncbi:hypothetical protein GDO81_023008 [Engystomops pustulosus]|uniref:Cytochrome P450 n=1 Tax=Engystomops pustulosus TaxID=76066 RepID=A0AAV6ZL61_ENGPU|nr:hypothetical protein GDO81_023008 [Engystomops pustulosus]